MEYLIGEQEGVSNTGSGLAAWLLKGCLEMKVAVEEWYRVRVAVEREGDAWVFSHASCWDSSYSLKLLRKVPVKVIPLSEHFKMGPESLFYSNKIYRDKQEYLRISSILYNYLHGLETAEYN